MGLSDFHAAPRVLMRKELLSLPWPSHEQLAEFVSQVSWAHSWYKHLPLLTGGEFVFFLATDAGAGYAPESPRLHYSWQTTQEYRDRFGFLDYAFRVNPNEPFTRDAGSQLDLPLDLVATTRVTLYPYVSNDFNAPEACLWDLHAQDFAQLKADQSYPFRGEILEWLATQERLSASWDDLTASERDVALREWDPPDEAAAPTPGIAIYRELSRAADAAYRSLQQSEEGKIRESLERLSALLTRWRVEEAC